jgi:hypothetical protein
VGVVLSSEAVGGARGVQQKEVGESGYGVIYSHRTRSYRESVCMCVMTMTREHDIIYPQYV